MLSEDDRRELASIEERLRADDRRFAETFRTGPSGDDTAVVVELGGALRQYAVGARPILDGF
jgi:Protein of unknown function (DUF3040)